MRFERFFFAVTLLAGLTVPATAVQINFTGGTVTLMNGTTQTTDNFVVWQDVDYYEEGGFRLDFIGNASNPFSAIIGNYYGAANDVIHSHWRTGGFGEIDQIKVTKIDGTAFDLNYFILTSNTDTGGNVASGNEQALIHASQTVLPATSPSCCPRGLGLFRPRRFSSAASSMASRHSGLPLRTASTVSEWTTSSSMNLRRRKFRNPVHSHFSASVWRGLPAESSQSGWKNHDSYARGLKRTARLKAEPQKI